TARCSPYVLLLPPPCLSPLVEGPLFWLSRCAFPVYLSPLPQVPCHTMGTKQSWRSRMLHRVASRCQLHCSYDPKEPQPLSATFVNVQHCCSMVCRDFAPLPSGT